MKPKNSGKHWTTEEKQILKNLAKSNTPTRIMGLKLKRTPEAIYAQAQKMNLSVKPVNQSPYG